MGPRMVVEDAAELKIVTSLNDVDFVSLSGLSPRRVNDVKLDRSNAKQAAAKFTLFLV